MGPLRADQVTSAKAAQIPEMVYEVFNALIAQRWNGYAATIPQQDVVDRLLDKDPSLSTTRIFREHLLDIEDAYRAVGWLVDYDKRGYNEIHEPAFIFCKPDRPFG